MADAIDLTDIDSVLTELQLADADTELDAPITARITSLSRSIMNHFKREFAPSVADDTRRFIVKPGGNGRAYLDLAPYDLQAATLVTLSPESTAPRVLIEWTDFRPHPLPQRHGVYTGIKFARLWAYCGSGLRNGELVVDVQGSWGFPDVPEDVKHWATVAVANSIRKDLSAYSTAFLIEEGRLERPEALPSAVIRGLSDYSREVLVR